MKITTQSPGERVEQHEAESATTRATRIPRAKVAANRQASRLALGADRLYQLGQHELVVWDTQSLAVTARHPCKKPRGVLALPDGGAVALCATEQPGYTGVLQVPAGGGAPQLHSLFLSCHPRELSQLFGHPGSRRFTVVSSGGATAVDEVELSQERGAVRTQRFELSHDAFYTLTPLATGEWLYDLGVPMRRDDQGEHAMRYATELPHVVHLVNPDLAAGPIAALADGSVVRFKVAGGSVEMTRITAAVGKQPYLLHAAGDKIAVAFVSEQYEVELRVYHESGRELFRARLPWTIAPSEAEQYALRVGGSRVVMGDGQRLAAWDLSSGAQLMPRPTANP